MEVQGGKVTSWTFDLCHLKCDVNRRAIGIESLDRQPPKAPHMAPSEERWVPVLWWNVLPPSASCKMCCDLCLYPWCWKLRSFLNCGMALFFFFFWYEKRTVHNSFVHWSESSAVGSGCLWGSPVGSLLCTGWSITGNLGRSASACEPCT